MIDFIVSVWSSWVPKGSGAYQQEDPPISSLASLGDPEEKASPQKAYFFAPAVRRVFIELPPKITSWAK